MIVKQNGGVVLMHDVKPITAKVIGEVLDDLEAENCRRLAASGGADHPGLDPLLPEGRQAGPRPAPGGAQADRGVQGGTPERCAGRPTPPPVAPTPPPSPAAKPSKRS